MSAVTPTDAARAEEVLIAHQRHRGGCLCGYAELGRSHAGHQVAMLCEAGLPPRAEPSPWRFDAPEVPAHVTAIKDADGTVFLRDETDPYRWRWLMSGGVPSWSVALWDALEMAPVVECPDPRAAS